MYGRSRVRVKVERGLTSTFTRGLSYIASISFMHVNVTCVRTEKLRVSANQPLPSRARRNTQSNTKRDSTVRETGERKTNVLSCFYTCFLILSFFFCQPGFHAPCRRLLVCFFFFFSARPRGTLIAAAIIKATGKLRINLSLRSLFWLSQLSDSPTSNSSALQNTPTDHEVFPYKCNLQV